MTTQMLKVLGELSNETQKALLLELPQNVDDELTIAIDGTVDTQELLRYLLNLSQNDEQKSEDNLSLQEEIELMLNIYDETRAADFSNKPQKSKM